MPAQWDRHDTDPIYWVLRLHPLIEFSREQMYDVPGQKVVNSRAELTPFDFKDVKENAHERSRDGLLVWRMTIGKKRHLFCIEGTTCGWTLFPSSLFFYTDSATTRMKHMILSNPPDAPAKLIGPRRYMDVRKAEAFMVGGSLPYDIRLLVARQFLDGDRQHIGH